MPAKQRYTPDQVVQALEAGRGMISVAARTLGCNQQTVHNYINKHERVRQAIERQREVTLDIAEVALMRAVQNGEGWAIAFTLKTLGRSRGYTERTEITGADGSPIVVETYVDRIKRLQAERAAIIELPERASA